MPSSRLRRAAAVVSSAALLLLGAAGAAFASPSVSVATNATIGHAILTDDQGLTLYHLTKDQDGASTCYDACAAAWPPVLIDALPTTQDANLALSLGLTQRTDGSQQLTYQNQPLYYFVGDANPGDTNGQASGGVWFVVDGPTP